MLVAPPHLSPSSINTFHQCPLKFKFNKIDGMMEPPTVHTLLGNFVHDILEALYLLPSNERTIDMAKGLARLKWEEYYEAETSKLRLNGREFRWKAWWCVENLWKLEDPQDTNLVDVEREVYGSIEGVTVKGFIDRFKKSDNGSLIIEDYKTGKIPDKRYMDDKFLQLFIYAAMLQELGVGETETVSLIYLTGPKVLTTPVTQDIVKTTVDKIVKTKSLIDQYCEDENFPTKTGPLCNWCNFKKICPSWTK
jgi:putative RecB family exonuclease